MHEMEKKNGINSSLKDQKNAKPLAKSLVKEPKRAKKMALNPSLWKIVLSVVVCALCYFLIKLPKIFSLLG